MYFWILPERYWLEEDGGSQKEKKILLLSVFPGGFCKWREDPILGVPICHIFLHWWVPDFPPLVTPSPFLGALPSPSIIFRTSLLPIQPTGLTQSWTGLEHPHKTILLSFLAWTWLMLSKGRAVVISSIIMSLWKEGKGSQCPRDSHKAPLLEGMWYVNVQGQSLWRSMPRDLISNAVLCESSMLPLRLHSDVVSCESETPTIWILTSVCALESHVLPWATPLIKVTGSLSGMWRKSSLP